MDDKKSSETGDGILPGAAVTGYPGVQLSKG
jgi:hypothetical protein